MKDQKQNQILGENTGPGKYNPELAKQIAKQIEQEEKQTRLEEKRKPKNAQPTQLPIVNPTNIPANTYWTIPGVKYRGNIVDVQVLKDLLDKGNPKTQDDWAKYSINARKRGDFYLPDFPLFYNTLETACSLKSDSQVEEFKERIKEISRTRWIMTLTRIKYNDQGRDFIVHDDGMPTQYELEESFIGEDAIIPAKSSVYLYQKLLGTDSSIDKIKQVFNWLNATETYIWRLNGRSNSLDERVAGFYASPLHWASLGCYRGLSSEDDGLGLRIVKNEEKNKSN